MMDKIIDGKNCRLKSNNFRAPLRAGLGGPALHHGLRGQRSEVRGLRD